MTNYQKTKIYKIESHLGDKIYIGSTAKEYLSQRFQQHKSSYKCWKNGKGGRLTSYELFDLYGIENCSIVLIETIACHSKDEKNAKESHYIRTMDCVNKCIPGRTQKAYENSEAGKAKKKAYRQSDTGQSQQKAYQDSEAGKAVKRAYYQKCKAIKQANINQSENGSTEINI